MRKVAFQLYHPVLLTHLDVIFIKHLCYCDITYTFSSFSSLESVDEEDDDDDDDVEDFLEVETTSTTTVVEAG